MGEWINKMCLYVQWRIIHLEKEGNSDTCYIMHEPGGCYTK